MESALRLLLVHPTRFAYGALGISVLVVLLSGGVDTGDLPLAMAQLVGFVGWLELWEHRHSRDPKDQSLTTIMLAVVGALLLASLAARHLIFSLVAVPLVVQYFMFLPLTAAVLAFLPLVFGAEYSHRRAILADPDRYPWEMIAIRGVAVIVVGIALRTLARQMDERTQLQASLASAERKAGRLEERQRLAREIHDTLAQEFAGILVHFERAEQTDSLAASPAKPHLDLARSVAREGLEDARRMLGALRPEILEQRALPEALARTCQEWSQRTGISAMFSVTGSPVPLHPDVELTVLRGTQEALTNVGRHSGAHSAAVTLSYMGDVVALDVQDDGKGFDPETISGTGYGLKGIRERVERLRGSFSIESLPGQGSTISFSVPGFLTSTGELLTTGWRS